MQDHYKNNTRYSFVFSSDLDIQNYDMSDITKINDIISKSPVEEKEYEEKMKILLESFQAHKEKLKKESSFPEKIGAKILVVCDGDNNTDLIKQQRKFLLDIYIKATPTSEFVILRLTRVSQTQTIAKMRNIT